MSSLKTLAVYHLLKNSGNFSGEYPSGQNVFHLLQTVEFRLRHILHDCQRQGLEDVTHVNETLISIVNVPTGKEDRLPFKQNLSFSRKPKEKYSTEDWAIQKDSITSGFLNSSYFSRKASHIYLSSDLNFSSNPILY